MQIAHGNLSGVFKYIWFAEVTNQKIAGTRMSNPYTPPGSPTKSSDSETNTWAMVLHLSIFASYLVPLLGLIAPIVIWQIKKDQMPILDEHGKIVVNWMISAFIYLIAVGLLCLIVIGFFLIPVLAIAAIVFPIIGGIKASNGEVWPYPLSIKFF